MANDYDQFFPDDEAAPAPSKPAGKPARAAAKPAPAPAAKAGGIKPPTFGMAVGIAVVSLLLGLGLGYFAGMYVASNSPVTSSAPTASVATSVKVDSPQGAAEGESLPAGHPDLSQFMNADGTVNQEALDAYLAEK